ncbi:uncharacterized protein [Dendropsophus ebraccatus]|uniref:uncharacterized protein n=1 Tax=Dendropsophus ebraccatus TaxID=150705 RepID=UPI003830FE3C
MILDTAKVLGSSVSHLQEVSLGLIGSQEETQVSRACLEIQVEYSTNLKMITQALQGGIVPLGLLKNLPERYGFSLRHMELWVNKWNGCDEEVCIGTSLIPITGNEQSLIPVTVLGIPVSDTQVILYHLQYTQFVVEGDDLVQLDLSSCLHFDSKIICLMGQDKVIHHSCYHNQTSCQARIEMVTSINDLVTQVELRKICFQVMLEEEVVTAFFSTCIHRETLSRGLYCMEGDVKAIEIQGEKISVTSIPTEHLRALPIQLNLTQVNQFPWQQWTEEIKKDKGLLEVLQKQLQNADITFQHQQGQLEQILHEWDQMSGYSWWKNLKKSVNMWSKTSVNSAAGNILSNPIVIISILVLLCIIYQIFLMYRMKKLYSKVKLEVNKGDNMIREMVKRIQNTKSVNNLEQVIPQAKQNNTIHDKV